MTRLTAFARGRTAALVSLACALAACMSAPEAAAPPAPDTAFTIAVLPDTQNYIDYTHQTDEGFPFDASEMFLDQMQYVAENLVSAGGEIAFVTSLGDVWQHPTLLIDEGHAARGFRRVASPVMDQYFAPTEETRTVEMPTAHEGFALIAGKTPFSVVPGNHDYDATWVDSKFPPKAMTREEADPDDPLAFGMLHPGGLDNFRAVFGADTPFFKGQPWYVASHDGGADSAQIFSAGGYRFLHIGLQFDPPDASLEWAASVMQAHKGLPTIISTHDYMNRFGERIPSRTLDGHAVDPIDNSPEMVWDKLIRQNDQVFLVLCGHQLGQGLRVDDNLQGHKVWQVLSDYQDRKQTAIEAGRPDTPIGDGWMRLMTFDMAGPVPLIRVKTYSTHYHAMSRDTRQYADWYKQAEKPDLTDEAFNDEDDFVIELKDFRARFESARSLTTIMVSGTQSGN